MSLLDKLPDGKTISKSKDYEKEYLDCFKQWFEKYHPLENTKRFFFSDCYDDALTQLNKIKLPQNLLCIAALPESSLKSELGGLFFSAAVNSSEQPVYILNEFPANFRYAGYKLAKEKTLLNYAHLSNLGRFAMGTIINAGSVDFALSDAREATFINYGHVDSGFFGSSNCRIFNFENISYFDNTCKDFFLYNSGIIGRDHNTCIAPNGMCLTINAGKIEQCYHPQARANYSVLLQLKPKDFQYYTSQDDYLREIDENTILLHAPNENFVRSIAYSAGEKAILDLIRYMKEVVDMQTLHDKLLKTYDAKDQAELIINVFQKIIPSRDWRHEYENPSMSDSGFCD